MRQRLGGQLFSKSFFYALLVTSTWSSKLVYLSPHFTSLPPLLILLYAPTFLLLDFVVVIVGRLLLHRTSNHRRLSALSTAIGGLVSVITWSTASSAIAFYLETSGEISWAAAGNFANDWDGIKLLLSGSLGIAICAFVIAIFSFAIRNLLYDGVGAVLSSAWNITCGRRNIPFAEQNAFKSDIERSLLSLSSSEGDEDFDEYKPEYLLNDPTTTVNKPRYPLWLARILVLAPFVTVAILEYVRPTSQPFPHMSETLPFTLLRVFGPPPNDFCLPGLLESMKPFPSPQLLSHDKWTPSVGLVPAWHPISDWSQPGVNVSMAVQRPAWLPVNGTIPGFERWTASNLPDPNFYHPELDPLKLSNINDDILDPIKDSLKSAKSKIKHIVLLTLESTRADVFPLTIDSHLYNSILASHSASDQLDNVELHELLSNISPVAELLTGTSNSSGLSEYRASANAKSGSWRARLAAKPSTLNVIGATTGSSMTFKSMLGTHCGVHPMPVEFTEESILKSYQPCIPHILDLFNRNKSKSTTKDLHNAPWRSVFAQSITDQYDRQDKLNPMMGFRPDNLFVKSNLTDPHSKYWPPTEPESNYFGFPEAQLKPYLQDLFQQVQEKGERLFLSHITSQTHHPFRVPEGFGDDQEYMGRGGWGKENILNSYLNTVRYGDNWLGDVMDMLDDAGMTNETLIVIVGDHGMAFAEDSKKHSSFENPHISSFRVPLAFQHPALPPMQLELNATNIQILPTILDLLLSSDSLSKPEVEVAKNLLPQYQGQSLLRPMKSEENGRELWTPAIITTGGAMLTIGSAASPFRLSVPICKPSEYRFTDISRDAEEQHPVTAWSMEALLKTIDKNLLYDDATRVKAVNWTRDAERIARWWSWETKRLWKYGGAAQQISRKGGESDGAGTIKKKHWWET